MDGMQYHTFPAVVDQTYYVTATPSSGEPDLSVFSSDGLPAYGILFRDSGTQIGDYMYYAGGPMTLRIDAGMSGTFWAGIYGYGAASDYDFIVDLAPDGYEADDVVGEATPIAVGSASLQVHNLHSSDPGDWLSFPATGGVTYVLETSDVGQSLDTVLYLYDSVGEVLLGSDDDSGTGTFSRLVWTCDVTGTYAFLILPFSSSYVGAYGVSVVIQ
jgi:hypothetical protein